MQVLQERVKRHETSLVTADKEKQTLKSAATAKDAEIKRLKAELEAAKGMGANTSGQVAQLQKEHERELEKLRYSLKVAESRREREQKSKEEEVHKIKKELLTVAGSTSVYYYDRDSAGPKVAHTVSEGQTGKMKKGELRDQDMSDNGMQTRGASGGVEKGGMGSAKELSQEIRCTHGLLNSMN